MKNIIFIAPPAAGKGAVSARVCDKYNIPHISTGDVLRDEIKNSTKLGLEIKDAMARGEFVSDEVITKLPLSISVCNCFPSKLPDFISSRSKSPADI